MWPQLTLPIILAEHDLVMLDLYAPWCGHCQTLMPEFEAAAAVVGGDQPATLVKVDVTANQKAARKYGVSQLPTMILIRGGEVIDTPTARTSVEIISYLREKASGDGSGGGGLGEIVMRNGEERVFIPINRDEPPAAAAALAVDDTKASYAAAKASMRGGGSNGGASDVKPHSGGGATQQRGKKKPTFGKMEQVGLDALEPGRGFTLEQWVFDPAATKNTPLADSGVLQIDFAVDPGNTGRKKKVVLGPEGAGELARVLGLFPAKAEQLNALAEGNGLSRMDLVGLEFGPSGMRTLAEPLRDAARATGLREVHFEFNDLGDDGAVTAVKALQGSQVSALHLSENLITDAGIEAIAPLLLELTELRVLFIGGNRFGDASTHKQSADANVCV